jgi:hypothetical protein
MSGSVMLALCMIVAHAHAGAAQAPLIGGWDIFSAPLTKGKIIYNVHDNGSSEKNVLVTCIITGSVPDHSFTVGAHFFDQNDLNSMPRGFGNWYVGEGCIYRPNATACTVAYDFGTITTDANGDGSAHFNLYAPPGTYGLQFTIRLGVGCGVPGPDGQPNYSGDVCSAVYQTGNSFANGFETIIIPN